MLAVTMHLQTDLSAAQPPTPKHTSVFLASVSPKTDFRLTFLTVFSPLAPYKRKIPDFYTPSLFLTSLVLGCCVLSSPAFDSLPTQHQKLGKKKSLQ